MLLRFVANLHVAKGWGDYLHLFVYVKLLMIHEHSAIMELPCSWSCEVNFPFRKQPYSCFMQLFKKIIYKQIFIFPGRVKVSLDQTVVLIQVVRIYFLSLFFLLKLIYLHVVELVVATTCYGRLLDCGANYFKVSIILWYYESLIKEVPIRRLHPYMHTTMHGPTKEIDILYMDDLRT